MIGARACERWCGVLMLVAMGSVPSSAQGGLAAAEETVALTLRVRVPASTPAADRIAVVGDFQGWRHDDDQSVLRRDDGDVHVIEVRVRPGRTVEFRFHRGSPSTEEARPDGSAVPSRRLRVHASRTLDLTVAAWLDDPAVTRSLTGDVTEHSDPSVLDGRRIWVYLPPGYHGGDRAYPMLLMLDGQNVFDRTTSFAGEWEVDETCERAIAAGRIEPLVVIAVDHGGPRRLGEYSPWPDANHGGGEGEEHLRRIVEEVLPWVRARYRVETEPQRVGFAGSSLGGLMALHVAATRTDQFGRIAALSPSIPWAAGRVLEGLRRTGAAAHVRLWVDMGTEEYGRAHDEDGDGVDDLVGALRQVDELLRNAGWPADRFVVFEDEGARHHEPAWAARFGRVLEFLFPRTP